MSEKERAKVEAQDALDLVASKRSHNCHVSQAERYIKALSAAREELRIALGRGRIEWGREEPEELRHLPSRDEVIATIKGLVGERARFRSIEQRLGIADEKSSQGIDGVEFQD